MRCQPLPRILPMKHSHLLVSFLLAVPALAVGRGGRQRRRRGGRGPGSTVERGAQTAARAAGIVLPLPVAGYEVLRASEPAAFRDCSGVEGRYLYRTRTMASMFGPVPAAP